MRQVVLQDAFSSCCVGTKIKIAEPLGSMCAVVLWCLQLDDILDRHGIKGEKDLCRLIPAH